MLVPTCEVGVMVAERGLRTLETTLRSLSQAGFPGPRLFADGEVAVPDDFPVTRRSPGVGGWPNFWLSLTEMICRNPAADFYLLVQDDVIFCSNTLSYLLNFPIPDDCGVVTLFCPTCYNGPFGWRALSAGYGFAGAQAFVFPRERAFQFLSHEFTVNHRRAAPRRKGFRNDGLHHIDGVVGEWCRRSGLNIYTHCPSLSQHIGHTSVMYPGFNGKADRRFADSFPGEMVDAHEVLATFSAELAAWIASGGSDIWTVPGHLWCIINGFLSPDIATLETGSGLSTKLFVEAGCDHTSLEHDAQWMNHLCEFAPAVKGHVKLCDLSGSPRWYDWTPDRRFDLVLIDGPPGNIGRHGILRVIDQIVHDDSLIFLDDAHRRQESQLCSDIAARLGWGVQKSTAGHNGYACIARELREGAEDHSRLGERRPSLAGGDASG